MWMALWPVAFQPCAVVTRGNRGELNPPDAGVISPIRTRATSAATTPRPNRARCQVQPARVMPCASRARAQGWPPPCMDAGAARWIGGGKAARPGGRHRGHAMIAAMRRMATWAAMLLLLSTWVLPVCVQAAPLTGDSGTCAMAACCTGLARACGHRSRPAAADCCLERTTNPLTVRFAAPPEGTGDVRLALIATVAPARFSPLHTAPGRQPWMAADSPPPLPPTPGFTFTPRI